MPYATPPTFVDTNILSAADLNTLSDNQEFFYSIGAGPNAAVSSQTTPDATDLFYYFRYRQRYLNFQYYFDDDGDDLDIYIYDDNGAGEGYEVVYQDGNPSGGTSTKYLDLQSPEGKVKLSSDTTTHTGADWNLALTLGNWYKIKVTVSVGGGGNPATTMTFDYLFNTDATSI